MSQNKTTKKEKFTIDVLMDENLIPEELEWHSSQGSGQEEKASAALIYLWDAKKMKHLVLIYGQKKCRLKK